MKIRADFVTNSSSSSYLCIAKVNLTDELRQWIKEEYGKFGERLLQKEAVTGAEIKGGKWEDVLEKLEYYDQLDVIHDEDTYITASFIAWTNDGDTEGNDAFLYRAIPDKYKEEVFAEDPD